MPATNPKWKLFERVVAAIHLTEESGAEVKWNDHINGRQFDVTIRFKFQFYDYLTVIECRDQKDAIKVTDVEAFVTKTQDAGANKAIIVTSSSFQSGAKTAASKHHIALFTLTELNDTPDTILVDTITSTLIVWPRGFWRTGTKDLISLSDDQDELHNQLQNIVMIGFGDHKLIEILKPISDLLSPFGIPGFAAPGVVFPAATKDPRTINIPLASDAAVIFPGSTVQQPVSHLTLSYWMQDIRLQRPVKLDPTVANAYSKRYQFTDVLGGNVTTIEAKALKLGFDNVFALDTFYVQPETGFYYFCSELTDTDAVVYLVESNQHGKLVRGRARVPLDHAQSLVPVTDEKEIVRLREMYITWRTEVDRREASPNTPPTGDNL